LRFAAQRHLLATRIFMALMGHTLGQWRQLARTTILFTAQMVATLAQLRRLGTTRSFMDLMDLISVKLPTARWQLRQMIDYA
jgi:hypothetical protein